MNRLNPKNWFRSGAGATGSQEGVQSSDPSSYTAKSAAPVTEDTALAVSEVWSCARLLSETFACLPVEIYDRNQPGVASKTMQSLRSVLTLSPNSAMTCVEFYETMQLNLCLHGNAYARIVRRPTDNAVVALWPISANTTAPVILKDGSIVYRHYHGGNVSHFAWEDLLHVKLFGNGVVGLSPMAYARNAIGLGSATDDYLAKMYRDGGKPSGVMYMSENLTRDQRDAVRAEFKEIVTSKEIEQRLLLLPGTSKYEATQLNPADMELLESRKFTTSQILRFMGNVPGPLVGHMAESTVWGSGIEQMFLAWYRTGLNPYASRWEQAIEKKLMSPVERLRNKVEFDFDALLRGDSKTQSEVTSKMVGGPVKTPNEGRAALGLPPLPGGDVLNPSPTESKKTEAKESS